MMKKTVFTLFTWLVVGGLVWMAGDRYGVPGFARTSVDSGFRFVEGTVSRGWAHGFGPEGRVREFLFKDREDKADDSDPEREPVSLPPLERQLAEIPATLTLASSGGVLPGNSRLRTNEIAMEIIKRNEALRLEAYEQGGKMRIGYGHPLQPGDPTQITAAEAERLLREDLGVTEEAIRRMLKREATDNQFSAMVSLAYTTGYGTFGRSSILSKFNDGDVDGSADAFLLYVKSGGTALPHLEHRRTEERALFLKS